MLYFITGGSASGKSEYAERLAVRLAERAEKSEELQRPEGLEMEWSQLERPETARERSERPQTKRERSERPQTKRERPENLEMEQGRPESPESKASAASPEAVKSMNAASAPSAAETPEISEDRLGIPLLYIATMESDSPAAAEKIRRHRRQREGKGFHLFEARRLAELAAAPSARTALFDCLSNFTANVIFSEESSLLSGGAESAGDKLMGERTVKIGECAGIIEERTVRIEERTVKIEECAGKIGDESGEAERILNSLLLLKERCENLIVVSDAVFSDGFRYDAGTEAYIEILGKICAGLAKRADCVVEIVFGLPNALKCSGLPGCSGTRGNGEKCAMEESGRLRASCLVEEYGGRRASCLVEECGGKECRR